MSRPVFIRSWQYQGAVKMLIFIGFVVAWVVVTTIISMIINTIRARNETSINDNFTAFCEGFVWGPIGILSGLDPRERVMGRATPKLIGGVVGTITAYNVFQRL